MKNLYTTIGISKDYLIDHSDSEETPKELEGLDQYNIKARIIKADEITVSGEDVATLFDSELAWLRFSVPGDRISELANLDGEVSYYLDGLRQAAKKYLDANEAN